MFSAWKRNVLSGGVAMVLATAMFGCDMFGGSDSDRSDRRSDRVDRLDRTDRISGVPDDARVVAEGRGRDLSYKADNDGRIYLYDATNERVVDSWDIDSGQRFTISPDNNAMSLDGREIRGGSSLSERSNYRLLFDRKD